jgi:hypothetical protein
MAAERLSDLLFSSSFSKNAINVSTARGGIVFCVLPLTILFVF